MLCKQVAICKRYFVNDNFAKESVFFVIEDADPSHFVSAMARFQVRDEDFYSFLSAYEKEELSQYLLLVSTDGKYASLSLVDGSYPIQNQDRLNLFGADLLQVPFAGETTEELQVEFWQHLFRYPELLRSGGVEPPPMKLKNRIDYSRVSWEELTMLAGVPEALGVPNIANAPDDAIFMGLFLAGVQTRHWESEFADRMLGELVKRLSDADLRGNHRYINYERLTPHEIAMRRLRSEQTLRDLHSIQFEFNLGYGRKTVTQAISKLKGDWLAEVAVLAHISESDFAEDLRSAYESRHQLALKEGSH